MRCHPFLTMMSKQLSAETKTLGNSLLVPNQPRETAELKRDFGIPKSHAIVTPAAATTTTTTTTTNTTMSFLVTPSTQNRSRCCFMEENREVGHVVIQSSLAYGAAGATTSCSTSFICLFIPFALLSFG